jgi:hypothetical protein
MLRIHVDPGSGLFVDDATFEDGKLVPGAVLSTDVAAYTLLALRTARRSLDSLLTLYGNTTPDVEGAPCLLDGGPRLDGEYFSRQLDRLIEGLSDTLYGRLTEPSGVAYGGWSVARGAPVDGGGTLDGHTAAVRGLLAAYLATGNTKFRDRALAVFQRLEAVFYDPAARIYRPTAGDTSNRVTFTARRFALLQAALRDVYELIGVNLGNDPLAAEIADPQVGRLGRLNKLVLDGWDDKDQDTQVAWPDECVRWHPDFDGPGSDQGAAVGGEGHILPRGGLQMAERALSGEVGSLLDVPQKGKTRVITTDREHDCVPELSTVHLPSALADSITFTLTPYRP